MNPILIYITIGAIAGISMGIIGMGAGVITVPLLVYNGMTMKEAVGASLLMQLLPQSLPGVIMYHGRGHIDIINSLYVILGSLIGILIGSYFVLYDVITEEMTCKILTVAMILITSVFIKNYLL
jgi:uncharacterized membrane protein YfcA